jgi:carbon-monoxide dehydrogenase large subunit
MTRYGGAQKGDWNGRFEDDPLLRGAGRFGGDLKPDGALAACFVRSHYHSVTHGHPIPDRNGKMIESPHRPALATGRVMLVGEPVTLVVAHTLGAAQDAADLVQVNYEELPGVIDPSALIPRITIRVWRFGMTRE